jgi:hypothetical protein
VVGVPATLISRYYDQPDHPERIPGGGKVTSPVREVVWTPAAPIVAHP